MHACSLVAISSLEEHYAPAEFARHYPFVILVHPKNANDDKNDKFCFTENLKHCGRRLLQSIFNHHKSDLMFQEFDIDNVVVSCNLNGMDPRPELKLCVATIPATEMGKIRNFINAGKVIKRLIKLSAGSQDVFSKLMDDANDFLKDLETPILSQSYMLVNHPALLPLHSLSQAFLRCYECIRSTMSPRKAQLVFAALPYGSGSSGTHWHDICMSHSLLLEKLTRYRKYSRGKEHLAVFLRNTFSHKTKRKSGYTPDEVDTIVYMFLPMAIVKLMKILFAYGYLQKIEIHLLF